SELSLQEIIRDWDRARQQATLPKTINQLAALRRRVQPEFIGFLDGYLASLKKYLQPGNSVLKKTVCQQLDQLDQQRAKLKSVPTRAQNSEKRTLTKQSDSQNIAKKSGGPDRR
ncbi:MAG: hypothetical protein M3Y82_14350, partial [Verrucomicrobiota bacterium]|nr:hypothetical protein [Verrucomicrobiota bacterium]